MIDGANLSVASKTVNLQIPHCWSLCAADNPAMPAPIITTDGSGLHGSTILSEMVHTSKFSPPPPHAEVFLLFSGVVKRCNFTHDNERFLKGVNKLMKLFYKLALTLYFLRNKVTKLKQIYKQTFSFHKQEI